MGILQDTLDSKVEEQLGFHRIGARLIEKKLQTKGVEITRDQLAEIESKLLSLQDGGFTITVDGEQVTVLHLESEEETKAIVRIDLHDSEKDIQEFRQAFAEGLSEAIPRLVDETSGLVLKQLKQDAPSRLRGRKRERTSFEAHIAKIWHSPLDLLDLFLLLAVEAGAEFNREVRPTAAEQNDCVFEVLTRLHARACQIASEVLALLRGGFADGAHARWRSLHEIAVVGSFIRSAGDQAPDLAERYLHYNVVESYKAALVYQKHCEILGYEPLSAQEFDGMKSDYEGLKRQYGDEYTKGYYGWAAGFAGKGTPNFERIEQKAGLHHLRPFYKMACHNVHANPRGVFFKLGLYPTSQDRLLAGPSDTGFADPGQGTAISLAQITTSLLTSDPNIDRLVICRIFTLLLDEIAEAFVRVQERLESTGGG